LARTMSGLKLGIVLRTVLVHVARRSSSRSEISLL
jgi:hypothetical protein